MNYVYLIKRFLLSNADDALSYKHGYFCTPIASRSSSAFPIFSNIVFQVF